eukprot:TRINITY_DN64295_c0_g1_i1.p1 TRINITY_DN64295_c0_g1~~TRINITY_DN64295_c0_g1_i1.p1  ORF type:complete len:351 (+),score=78.11 TRINITY_DN64295_c0_g1_i1:30-1082(+)
MASDGQYYLDTYADFKDMGLDDAAVQVLKEGLAAHPSCAELLKLGRERGLDTEPAGTAGERSQSGSVGELFTSVLKSHLPSPQAAAGGYGAASGTRSVLEPVGQLPLAAAELESEMQGAEFWSELRTRSLQAILQERGGLVRVSDVLPGELAEQSFTTMQSLQASDWKESNSATYDDAGTYGDKTAKHWFYRYDGDQLDGTLRELHSLAPALFPSFQAAKYETSGNLSAHDDSNFFVITNNDKNRSSRYPAGTVMFRKIAVIYYLTKDWRQEFGGSLMDLHGQEPRCLVPRFNSLVAFLVPRVHQVEELAAGCPPRFSLFGWFSEDQAYPAVGELRKMPWLSTLESRGQR